MLQLVRSFRFKTEELKVCVKKRKIELLVCVGQRDRTSDMNSPCKDRTGAQGSEGERLLSDRGRSESFNWPRQLLTWDRARSQKLWSRSVFVAKRVKVEGERERDHREEEDVRR